MIKRILFGLSLASFLLLPVPAFAQQDSTALDAPSKELETVVVKADPVRTKSDRITFTIPEVARKRAANAMELFSILPGVAINPQTRLPEMISGESYLVLVNGVQTDVSILGTMPTGRSNVLRYLMLYPCATDRTTR